MKRVAVAYYRTLSSQSSASLTAGYLTAFLRDNGLHVKIHQLEAGSAEHDVQALFASAPDLVFFKPNFQDAHRLGPNLSALASQFPQVAVGLFGPFAALNAESLLQQYPTVRGIILPNHEFLAGTNTNWWKGENSDEAPEGIVSRRGSTICFRPVASSIVKANAYRLRPARDIEEREPIVIANLEASRGCFRGCTFCHIPQNAKLSGVPVLRRSVDDVVEEMCELRALGKQYFIFNDSIMGGGGSADGTCWLQQFADRLRGEPREYLFMAYFTLDLLDANPKLIDDLAEAGMIRVFVGVEAATHRALGIFRKPVAVSRYGPIKAWLRDRFIVPHIGFILFHPFAEPDDISAGIDFLYSNDELHRFATVREAARLVPGTELMRQALSAGLIVPQDAQDTPHPYRYANPATAVLRERMSAAWDSIGVPLLERLEHLFVTGLFIENIVRRRRLANDRFVKAAGAFHQSRAHYGSRFYSVMTRQLSASLDKYADESEAFRDIVAAVEQLWSDLVAAASSAGLESPLAWVTTGDLRSEVLRPPDYDGRWPTTRSGRIRADHR